MNVKAFRKLKRLISFEDEVKALKYKDLPLAVAERRSKIELELIVAFCWNIWHYGSNVID